MNWTKQLRNIPSGMRAHVWAGWSFGWPKKLLFYLIFHEGPQLELLWAPARPPTEPGLLAGERRGKEGLARPCDTNISHKHKPATHRAPPFPPQLPCTEKSLQSFIAFKNYRSDKVTAWPCPGFKSERWQDIHYIPMHPLWSTGILLPYPSHRCPNDVLVVGSMITKYR